MEFSVEYAECKLCPLLETCDKVKHIISARKATAMIWII